MADNQSKPPLTLAVRLARLDKRVEEIEAVVAVPEVARDPAKMTALMRERGRLMHVVDPYRRWRAARAARREAEELLKTEHDDAGLRALAETEIEVQGDIERKLLEELQQRLLDREEGTDATRVILEVRAGTGGEEAALFARDLYQMYCRYADARGWKRENLSASPTDLGGLRDVIFALEGDDVFKRLRFESGGHRVQRVPETEAQGRIHTSAATVAVMAEPEPLDIQIREEDLEVETMRASGPGGQKVNKTSSAVRMRHKPTGIMVHMQDEKSQHRNREKALRILTARVYDLVESKKRAERAADRKSKIGSGDRSERIRTYNFPQNRLTDHRINYTTYNLDRVVQGDLDGVVGALLDADRAAKIGSLEGAE
ncbi:MAG: peptide chain release factor 1 [Planctomycetes bacterium]|nr:peptide chain release factor 1 [Planctomycetota bacterium]